MTSLTVTEFEALLPAFAAEYAVAYPPTLTKTGQPRKRRVGGGAKSRLAGLANKLLFVLVYHKTYTLQTAHGLQFGYSQPRANELLHDFLPLVQKTLQRAGYAPLRDGAAVAADPAPAYQLDGTERRRQRPENAENQRDCYSGKKKAHTDKNLVLIAEHTETVSYLSPTGGGAHHDKKVADEAAIQYPPGSTLTTDLGFQGYEPAGVQSIHPHKKKRGRALRLYEVLANSLIAQARVVVEHIIARIKRCRIIKDVFRNTKAGLNDMVMEIACGLHNLRTEFRHAHSPTTIAAHVYSR